MRLNHVNLPSSDVDADITMFETYFGFQLLMRRGATLGVLYDDGGLSLTLNNLPKKLGGFAYPDDSDVHHIGFRLESPEAVDAMHMRLTNDGWNVPPPHESHRAWTFYFKAPGGYTIEVFHQRLSA